jgi:hypothetical protein
MSQNPVDHISEELASEVHLSMNQIDAVLDILSKRGVLNLSPTNETGFALVDEPDGITQMSFNRYLALSIEQRHSLALALQKRNWQTIQSELQKRNTQWMLICGDSILESSANWEKLPTDERIRQLGSQQNRVPLVFVRNPLIEEQSALPCQPATTGFGRQESP